jgi:excisionase family DNA binding protein
MINNYGQKAPAPALLFGEAFLTAIREAVRAELQAIVAIGHSPGEMLTPEELADKLKLPVSWVYEQSRQGNIPTHRLGRYLRFNVAEVLESQKKRGESS